MKNVDALTQKILEYIGNKDNVTYCGHCFTRLRIEVKDKESVDVEAIKKLDGVLQAQFTADQFQIVIGPEVTTVYDSLCKIGHFNKEETVHELIKSDIPFKTKLKNHFNNLISTVTACINPLFPVLITGGMLRLVVTLLGSNGFGLVAETNTIIQIFSIVTETAYHYLPVYIAYVAAGKFKASPVLAICLSLIILNPTVNELIGLSFISYSSSFIEMILIVWVLAKVERFFKNIVPSIIRDLLCPLSTMLVMLPLCLCVLGPCGYYLTQSIVLAINSLRIILGPIATALVGAVFPLLIAGGMHNPLNVVAYSQFFLSGYDNCILAGSYFMDFQLLGMVSACCLKAKKPQDKALAKNALMTEAIGGISEPAIYNFMLKKKTNTIAVVVAGALAGLYIGLTNTGCYIMSNCGIFSFLAYAGKDNINLLNGIIACLIAFIASFILTLILNKEDIKHETAGSIR